MGLSPIGFAFFNGKLDTVKRLKKMGGNLHVNLQNNNTLFHASVIQNLEPQMLDLLKHSKIDINAQNNQVYPFFDPRATLLSISLVSFRMKK